MWAAILLADDASCPILPRHCWIGVCIKSWNWATRIKTIRHGLYLDGKFVLGVWDWDLNVSYHERLSKARGLKNISSVINETEWYSPDIDLKTTCLFVRPPLATVERNYPTSLSWDNNLPQYRASLFPLLVLVLLVELYITLRNRQINTLLWSTSPTFHFQYKSFTLFKF